VQADPIKPSSKAPGTKRRKLKYDKLLSNFAFKFNLRRCNEEMMRATHAFTTDPGDDMAAPRLTQYTATKVWRCRLTLANPTRNRAGCQRLILECHEPLSNAAFNFNFAPLHQGRRLNDLRTSTPPPSNLPFRIRARMYAYAHSPASHARYRFW